MADPMVSTKVAQNIENQGYSLNQNNGLSVIGSPAVTLSADITPTTYHGNKMKFETAKAKANPRANLLVLLSQRNQINPNKQALIHRPINIKPILTSEEFFNSW